MKSEKKLAPSELKRWEADRRRDQELRAQFRAREAEPRDEPGTHTKDRPNGKQFNRLQARLDKIAKKRHESPVKAGLVARPTNRLGATVILDVTVKDHLERSEVLLAKAQKKQTKKEIEINPKGAGRKLDLSNDLLVIEAARQLNISVTDCPKLIERVTAIATDSDSEATAKSRIRAALITDRPRKKKICKFSQNP